MLPRTGGADGKLKPEMWEFSPRFCDSIPAALERLAAEGMGPAMVRFHRVARTAAALGGKGGAAMDRAPWRTGAPP